MKTEKLQLSADIQREIFGRGDSFVRRIEEELGVAVVTRGGELQVSGESPEAVSQAVLTLRQLAGLAGRGTMIEDQNVNYLLDVQKEARDNPDLLPALDSDVICHTTSGKPIKPKTIGQEKYIQAIRDHLIVFANGPAGTGKTFLAMAMAITAFQNHEVERIILTRPAIEAGEKLGFLPGISRARWTRTCARSTMRCIRLWAPINSRPIWRRDSSRWRRSLTCAGARWTMPISFWMKRRTRRPSR